MTAAPTPTTFPTLTYAGRRFVHVADGVVRRMTEAERDALSESIGMYGIRQQLHVTEDGRVGDRAWPWQAQGREPAGAGGRPGAAVGRRGGGRRVAAGGDHRRPAAGVGTRGTPPGRAGRSGRGGIAPPARSWRV
jgi:hypothetical protein